jgi:hypothetical protein
MSAARPGPVLAYSHPGISPASPAFARSDLDRLLASHGFVLERGVRASTGTPVLRLVDRETGRPPAHVPMALAADLAARVATEGRYPALVRG